MWAHRILPISIMWSVGSFYFLNQLKALFPHFLDGGANTNHRASEMPHVNFWGGARALLGARCLTQLPVSCMSGRDACHEEWKPTSRSPGHQCVKGKNLRKSSTNNESKCHPPPSQTGRDLLPVHLPGFWTPLCDSTEKHMVLPGLNSTPA